MTRLTGEVLGYLRRAVFPPTARGRALSILITSIYLGLSLGPVLGGFLIAGLGWRALWLPQDHPHTRRK